MWKEIFQISLGTMDFGKIFMRQSILLGHFLCDRVQGVESFATHPRHFPSRVPPRVSNSLKQIISRNHTIQGSSHKLRLSGKRRLHSWGHFSPSSIGDPQWGIYKIYVSDLNENIKSVLDLKALPSTYPLDR